VQSTALGLLQHQHCDIDFDAGEYLAMTSDVPPPLRPRRLLYQPLILMRHDFISLRRYITQRFRYRLTHATASRRISAPISPPHTFATPTTHRRLARYQVKKPATASHSPASARHYDAARAVAADCFDYDLRRRLQYNATARPPLSALPVPHSRRQHVPQASHDVEIMLARDGLHSRHTPGQRRSWLPQDVPIFDFDSS
jgi:hypothetical protein